LSKRVYTFEGGMTITEEFDNEISMEAAPLLNVEATSSPILIEEYDNLGDTIKSNTYYSIEDYDHARSVENVICHKQDGFCIIVKINEKEHGFLGNESSPAHIHICDLSLKEVGQVNINGSCPSNGNDVVLYRTSNVPVFNTYRKKIAIWANALRKDIDFEQTNWEYAKAVWKEFENERENRNEK
jgi:hypothetical protein